MLRLVTHASFDRRWLAGMMGALAALLLCMTAETVGQYAVNQQVHVNVQQDGRLFDANPALYGGRYNSARPVSPLIGGNPYASGIVGRGLSLRIGSAIPDETAFRAPLGSSSLYTFRRDSVSVGQVTRPLGTVPLAQPYYDPATTVVSPRFLQDLTISPRTARSASGALDQRLDLRLPLTSVQLGLYAEVPSSFQEPAQALASGIFGPQQVPRLQLPVDAVPELPWRRQFTEALELPGVEGETADEQPSFGARDPREEAERFASPLDHVLRGDTALQIGLRQPGEEAQPWSAAWRGAEFRPGLIVPEPVPVEQPRAAVQPAKPRIMDPTVLPGFEVFTDMRLALALAEDPSARWFQEMQEAALAEPTLAQLPAEEAADNSAEFLDQMLNTPLRTFTGRGASMLNDLLLKAESLMAIGHYYEAADRYDAARALAPGNPLPLLGKGHALLAAGDYRSAAFALMEGIERFPEVARFPLDLRSLMGSGEAIDIRRADIMQRIQQSDSPELLFLLGYLEYHTGDRARGLETLERAARHPRAHAVIARYPAMLRGEGPLPPPRLGDVPPVRTNRLPEEELVVPPAERP